MCPTAQAERCLSLSSLSIFLLLLRMSIVKSAKSRHQLLLSSYRYYRANKPHIIWRCCRNDYAGRVCFDAEEYNMVTGDGHVPNPDETISMEFKSNTSFGTAAPHNLPQFITYQYLGLLQCYVMKFLVILNSFPKNNQYLRFSHVTKTLAQSKAGSSSLQSR